MNKELELQLVKEFPTFFRKYGGDMRVTCMHWGCSHGDGWYNLLRKLCSRLSEIAPPNFCFEQIKEKFGRLTVYCSGGNKETQNLVDAYEEMSLGVCERCGGENNVTTEKRPWWIGTLCEDCGNKGVSGGNGTA